MTKGIETYRLVVTREELCILRAAIHIALANKVTTLTQAEQLKLEAIAEELKS